MTENNQNEKLLRFQFGTVKKLVKFDPEVKIVSQESVFLIAKAAEIFLFSLAKEAYTYTANDAKKTVMRRHVDAAISEIDAMAFLDGTLD